MLVGVKTRNRVTMAAADRLSTPAKTESQLRGAGLALFKLPSRNLSSRRSCSNLTAASSDRYVGVTVGVVAVARPPQPVPVHEI